MGKNDETKGAARPEGRSDELQALTGKAAALAERVSELERANAQLKAERDEVANLLLKEREGRGAVSAERRGTHIRVAALADGYFRAGLPFGRQPRELAIAELSEEQLTAIRSDARLVVVDL